MTARPPRAFELPMVLIFDAPPLTANQRMHWTKKSRRTREIREHVGWQARAARVPACDHIVVRLHYVPLVQRRRDPSNLMPTQKPAVDGLVDAGVVPDDTPEFVTELMPVIHPVGTPRLWLEVRATPGPLTPDELQWISDDSFWERTADAADTGEDR